MSFILPSRETGRSGQAQWCATAMDSTSVGIGCPTGHFDMVATTLEAWVNVCCRGVLVLAFVEDGYSELHMDAWDFLAGLLIFEEAGDIVSGPPCSRTLRLAD